MKLDSGCFFVRGRSLRGRLQKGRAVIINIRRILCHYPAEKHVNKIQDAACGAEVGVEVNAQRPGEFSRVNRRRGELAEKNLRLGTAKSINALLDVTDNKDVIRAAEGFNYSFLNRIDILILVNKDIAILSSK